MMDIDRVDRSLALLRSEISPDSTDKERLRVRLGLPPKTPPSNTPEPRSGGLEQPTLTRWTALRASGQLGAVLGIGVLGAGIGIGFWLRGETNAVRRPAATAMAAPVRSPQEAVEPETLAPRALPPADRAPAEPEPPTRTPELSPAQPPRSAHRHTSSSVGPAPKIFVPTPLDAELGLLRRVEHALRTNDANLALGLLGELDERFPDTRLAEERLAARRIAECRSGTPGAALHARDFLGEHATSVYSERVRAACLSENMPISNSPLTMGASPDTHSR
jgi:hypothetical protein